MKKSNAVFLALKELFFATVLLFFCSVPIFYALLDSGLGYLSARFIGRPILVLAVAIYIRKKHRAQIAQFPEQRTRTMRIVIACLVIALFLESHGILSSHFENVTYRLQIFNGAVPLLVAVAWEQFFAGDLFWSLFVGAGVVCIDTSSLRHAERTKAS